MARQLDVQQITPTIMPSSGSSTPSPASFIGTQGVLSIDPRKAFLSLKEPFKMDIAENTAQNLNILVQSGHIIRITKIITVGATTTIASNLQVIVRGNDINGQETFNYSFNLTDYAQFKDQQGLVQEANVNIVVEGIGANGSQLGKQAVYVDLKNLNVGAGEKINTTFYYDIIQ